MAKEVDLILQVTGVLVSLMVRSKPSINGKIIGRLSANQGDIHATKESDGWFYLPDYGGWSNGQFFTITDNNDKKAYNPDKDAVQPLTDKQKDSLYRSETETLTSSDSSNYMAKSLEGIMGVPYQFMESVDKTVPGTQYGHTYGDRIVSRMPLLLLTPGKVNFTRDWKSKNDAASALMHLVDTATPTELNDLIDKQGRYFTFDYDYATYYNCVNAMMTSGAAFLGIENVQIQANGKWEEIKNVDWSMMGQDSFKQILSPKEYVAFYIDSATSASESFGNSTTESQLANKVNSFSDQAKEIQFLTGVAGGPTLDEDAESNVMTQIDDITNKYLNGSQLFKDIGSNFATVACGGKLLFPEIWSDSDFSKDYDISLKLRTPDKDPVSWYMNIYRPLAHLVCMTAPMQSNNPNGYVSPFLVRAYYKGLFNCDMGIITSLSIQKGKDNAWTLDGLPTEVDVSVTIKDLYNMVTLVKEMDPGTFVNNISLMSYVANTCGVNINEPDIMKMLDVYVMLKFNKITHAPSNIWNNVMQNFSNRYMSIQESILNLLR